MPAFYHIYTPNHLLLEIAARFCYNSDCAGVSEWQTRKTQNLLWATTCGFKSLHRHQGFSADCTQFAEKPLFFGFIARTSMLSPIVYFLLFTKLLYLITYIVSI